MSKICVTSQGADMDALMDPRFGRCRYFIIVDLESGEFDAIDNDAISHAQGAGIRAAQTVVSTGVDAIITGSVGPNAYPALQNAGIRILTATSGTIRDVVESYKHGSLIEVAFPGPAHAGIGRGMGRGRGRGGRRGGY
ncbi:MAG: NifB/NifX family molybdenum-iron cluster-binding protein [Candidatus Thorarchaeota archaeon]